MKKSNFLTLLLFAVLIIAVIIFSFFTKQNKKDNLDDDISEKSSYTESTDLPTENTSDMQSTLISGENENNSQPEPDTADKPVVSKTSLFIGDSRTVGIMEYSGLADTDFFCNVGMNVFNAVKDTVSVPNVGKITLNELLVNKKYGKIYVMLGINELGYNTDTVIKKYGELLDLIKETQPDAVIFIEANLHVTKDRSDGDNIINNRTIDSFNTEISKLADNKTVFYIDANSLFDDTDGNLSADKTQDNVHLYAKYYAEWGEWICRETEKYVEEG